MMIKRLPDPNIKVLLVFGVLDSSVYPALLEETDDGLVVEVELGVDVLGQGLAATLTGYLTATVSTDQVTDLSTQHQSVNKTEILNGEGSKPGITALKIIFYCFTLISFIMNLFNV